MPVDPFVFQARPPQRVVFGKGRVDRVSEEAVHLGIRRAIVLSTPEQADHANAIAGLLGEHCGAVFSHARMHTPVDVTEQAMAIVRTEGIDGTVAIGGGSTTGLGKAIAYRTDLPQIAVPTTYAGSEMTDILGETADGSKKTLRDPKVVPETVIYDVALTLALPAGLSVTSGMNAIAHAVEALYAPDGNPVVSLLAEEGIRSFAAAIPAIPADPANEGARADALYGAWLCGIALASTSMALHHKLCHVLGGSFDLPHAETHTVILPHAVAYNAEAARPAMERIARALGADAAAQGLFDLAAGAGAPTSLRELGMHADALDRAADIAVANPYSNPRPIERDAIRALLDDAWHGRRPATA